MEPEISLSCSHGSATGSCPELCESIQQRSTLFHLNPILILLPHLYIHFRGGIFPSVFLTKILYLFYLHMYLFQRYGVSTWRTQDGKSM